MNKYQEALDNVREDLKTLAKAKYYGGTHLATLQELVDKETPRTEQEILKDFEKLGYEVKESSDGLCLFKIGGYKIDIRKYGRKYYAIMGDGYMYMQEHKLLNELFTIWGWI